MMSASIFVMFALGFRSSSTSATASTFLLPDEAPAADMPDDVLGPEDVVVDEREIADAGHDELKRDARAAGAASRHEYSDIREQARCRKGIQFARMCDRSSCIRPFRPFAGLAPFRVLLEPDPRQAQRVGGVMSLDVPRRRRAEDR